MIIKSFEVTKINLNKNQFYLFYGENEGFKKEIIEKKFKKFYNESTYVYEENEIFLKQEEFFNNILSRSFFEKEKLVIINRVTDKFKDIIKELLTRKIEDFILILNTGRLEKKSELRSLFEKDSKLVCIPFYEDNNQILNSLINQFFRNKKIPISQQLINILIERSRGDRKNLNNELTKIENFSLDKKNINLQEIVKLTNLAENYSASELIDHSLAKNTRKTLAILNENNFSDEDNIIIIRTLLAKLKKLVKIYKLIEEKKKYWSSNYFV